MADPPGRDRRKLSIVAAQLLAIREQVNAALGMLMEIDPRLLGGEPDGEEKERAIEDRKAFGRIRGRIRSAAPRAGEG